ncbi:MAG TPA: hypothetical protein VF600_14030 [Abditibacteriaceae bacterium]|jgi:hypothetical protein
MDFIPQNAPRNDAPPEEVVAPVVLSRREKWKRTRVLWAGFAASNLVGLLTVVALPRVLEALSSWFAPRGGGTFVSVLGISMFVAIPLSMGAISALVWKPLQLPKSHLSLYSASNTILAVGGSAVVLREGAICLLMASPILWVMIWSGCLMGEALFNWVNRPLRMSLLPLFALCLFQDVRSSNVTHEISDEVTIRATPAQVWHQVKRFPPVDDAPEYWLFKMGMPMPIVSKLYGEKIGAKRECILTGGLVFDEKVTVWKLRQQLTFDVVRQPDHPELTGHFKLLRGEFRLRDNKNGTTSLMGTSWYRLNVRPLWYWQLWADDAIRHVHLRVMHHIRDEAERKA